MIGKVGVEVGKRVIGMRKDLRDLISLLGGKVIHPVFGLPGGVAKPMAPADQPKFIEAAKRGVDFALFTLGVFTDVVLKNQEYVDAITSDMYTHKTYYMGLVDGKNRVNFYDGRVRVVDPNGEGIWRFHGARISRRHC